MTPNLPYRHTPNGRIAHVCDTYWPSLCAPHHGAKAAAQHSRLPQRGGVAAKMLDSTLRKFSSRLCGTEPASPTSTEPQAMALPFWGGAIAKTDSTLLAPSEEPARGRQNPALTGAFR